MAARSSAADRNAWLFLGGVLLVAVTLGILQWRWINELSQAHRDRLKASLQNSLVRVSEDFNAELNRALREVGGASNSLDLTQRSQAYALRFAQLRQRQGILRSIALAIPTSDRTGLVLEMYDPAYSQLRPATWPSGWQRLRERLVGNLTGRRGGSASDDIRDLVERPIFAEIEGPGRGPEAAWLIAELDLDWIEKTFLPSLLRRHLGDGSGTPAMLVAMPGDAGEVVFGRRPASRQEPDATVRLFQADFAGFAREGRRPPPPPSSPLGPAGRSGGRWVLNVWHSAGALDDIVKRGRQQNIAITATLLALLMAAAGALVRFTRRAQRLAELQIQFVAGVSHELKTPLTVMRTAGHNLRGPQLSHNPERVQHYGALIEEESTKLGSIVEGVLRFATMRSGSLPQTQTLSDVGEIVARAVHASMQAADRAGMPIKTFIQPLLPPVMADEANLTSTIVNVIENAAKYGEAGTPIRVSVETATARKQRGVNIRVWNSGRPIGADEIDVIFDPFVRGRRAIEDQIHGTGLGLSLVRRIVEAHGGFISVSSSGQSGTEFIVHLPAASQDQIQDAATSNSAG